MVENILNSLLDFKWLIAISLPLGLILLPIGLNLGDSLTWAQRRMKIFGIFYNLTNRESVWLATGIIRVLFVAMILIFAVRMSLAHTIFFVLLCVGIIGLFFGIKRLFFELINSGVIYVGLVIANILMGYSHDVGFDLSIIAVYVLLSIFLVIYTIYVFLKGVSELMQYKISKVPNADPELSEEVRLGQKGAVLADSETAETVASATVEATEVAGGEVSA